jgi:hypothetical protein
MIQFKVNLIISNLAGGGAEGVCITIANGLFNLGHDVQLIVLNENKIDIKSRLNENINYFPPDFKLKIVMIFLLKILFQM